MSADLDLLLRGLDALAGMLPDGCQIEPSSLSKRTAEPGEWIVIRQGNKHITCLVLSRRRVESRDLGAIAAVAARTQNPALLVSSYLTPSAREGLRGFGLGYWDITGNIHIDLPAIDLAIAAEGGTGTAQRHAVRSLAGEKSGRVARTLVDIAPPYPLGTVAALARVEPSYASRVVSYLAEAGLVQRRQRGTIETVHWPDLVRRLSLDAPPVTRGEHLRTVCPEGLPDFLRRLGRSGFLHALTGEIAMARRLDAPLPSSAVLYVDDPREAVAQFRLRPTQDGVVDTTNAEVVLVTPADRSVYQRSTETAGLRCVSPSLIAVDLPKNELLEQLIAWMARNETAWRLPSPNLEHDQGSKRRKHRRKSSDNR